MKKTFSALLTLATLAISTLPAQAGSKNEYEGWYGVSPVAQQTGPARVALQAYGLVAADGTTTATAASGAVTLSKNIGTITSEALTTAAGADYTLTITNTLITATSYVYVSVDNGTNTTAGLAVGRITPGSGSLVVLIRNTHASAALNGTLKIRFAILQ
jgi:hypothetical protein